MLLIRCSSWLWLQRPAFGPISAREVVSQGYQLPARSPELVGAKIHLIESNGKKAAFLRAAVKATAVPAIVHHMRVEKFGESCAETVQVVTARAVAPLKTLCVQAFPFIAAGAIGLFPKGQDVASELTDAAKYWRLQASRVPSRTSPDGSIVVISGP